MLLFHASDETSRHSYPPRIGRPAESGSQGYLFPPRLPVNRLLHSKPYRKPQDAIKRARARPADGSEHCQIKQRHGGFRACAFHRPRHFVTNSRRMPARCHFTFPCLSIARRCRITRSNGVDSFTVAPPRRRTPRQSGSELPADDGIWPAS